MISINIYLRFALIAGCLLIGIILTVAFGFWYAFPLYLIAVGLLVGYFLLGTVQSAAQLVQLQDIEGAEKRLDLTFFPNLLYVTNRAYYFLMRGTVAQVKKDNAAAEMWLGKAEALELPSDNERAMVKLQLANIAAQRNQWPRAKQLVKDAKAMKVTEASIKDQLQQFDTALQQQAQSKNARMQSGGRRNMHMGGKRRRPRVR